MNFHNLLLLLGLLFSSCLEKSPIATNSEPPKSYPEDLKKVFDAHGGLSQWQLMNAMSYDIVNGEGKNNEEQYIDLKNRNERINGTNFTMGYDGDRFWLEADSTYKGNPIFYKNLMFYFYAMPFVLADPGIKYNKVDDLVYGDKSYPGYRISYEADIGVSPEDEYFIHYDPDSYQMAWLAYTVTYFTKEQSTKIKWIRYDDWAKTKDLILPKSLAWYELDENRPVSEKKRRHFENIIVQKESFSDSIFVKTSNAEYIDTKD